MQHGYGVIMHSAKGSEWENHKYVRKVDGTYYYLDADGNETTHTYKDASKDPSKKDDVKSKDTEKEKNSGGEISKEKAHNLSAEDMTPENIEKLAKQVIRGSFGNGQIRKDILGDNYAVVQKRVNELMKASKDTSSAKTSNSENDKKTATTSTKAKKKATKTRKKTPSIKSWDDVINGGYVKHSYLIHMSKDM